MTPYGIIAQTSGIAAKVEITPVRVPTSSKLQIKVLVALQLQRAL